MTQNHTAAKIATFGQITDQTETRWCPDCEIVSTLPTIPPEKEGGSGLDDSIYDCDECGELMELYHPEMNYDRCGCCGDYIDEGAVYCESCDDAETCATEGCERKAPWGEYCHPQCEDRDKAQPAG